MLTLINILDFLITCLGIGLCVVVINVFTPFSQRIKISLYVALMLLAIWSTYCLMTCY